MKIAGIICEYNPFHNGHLYHIEQTRKSGATHIVAVMSGNFVQRGDIAVMDKFERAKLAVRCGADLVIEIPAVYSLSSAEFYARGAVHILNSLGCVERLSFGSECGNENDLSLAAIAGEECSASDELEQLLRGGMSYPNAMSTLVREKYGYKMSELFRSPNNLLGIEYIKALKKCSSSIKPFTVTRKSAMHDSMEVSGGIASASYIRKCIGDGTDFSEFVPKLVSDAYKKCCEKGMTADISNLERIILYTLRMTDPETLMLVPDVGQGLEYRICESASSSSLEELLSKVKTKRYTMARIKRILLSMLIGIKKQDMRVLPPYGRILSLNERGCEILSKAKGKSSIPFSTSLSKLAETSVDAWRFAQLEAKASDIYGLAMNSIHSSEMDYRAKIGVIGDGGFF